MLVDDLIAYENNPRNNDEAVDYVAESIKEFGFKVPIVIDKNNVIVAGHTRYKACKKLNINEVPCLVADDLTDEQIKAFRLADNKVAEVATWDFEKLDLELSTLELDMELFGFESDTDVETQEVVEDEFEVELPEEPKAKYGDIYQLGNHRLMCGDSTKVEDVEKLMNGKKADMVFTDPPYALFGNSTGVAGICDDKMTRPFFLSIFKNLKQFTKLFGHIYVCCDWHSAFSLQAMAKDAGLTEKNLCIWDKGDGGVGAMYQQCYEMIWFFANSPLATKTIGKQKSGERTINGKPNIWRYNRVQSNERVHNAQKPVEMIKFAIENSSDNNENVLDLFGGSGSTLIACEQLNRSAYLMELDPKYVDVIINRWEQFTGEKAVLLNGDNEDFKTA